MNARISGDVRAPLQRDISSTMLGTYAPLIPEWDHKRVPLLALGTRKNRKSVIDNSSEYVILVTL
jgi:hypothetical protein